MFCLASKVEGDQYSWQHRIYSSYRILDGAVIKSLVCVTLRSRQSRRPELPTWNFPHRLTNSTLLLGINPWCSSIKPWAQQPACISHETEEGFYGTKCTQIFRYQYRFLFFLCRLNAESFAFSRRKFPFVSLSTRGICTGQDNMGINTYYISYL